MAIVGLVFMVSPHCTEKVQQDLLQQEGITDVQPTADSQRLVAVLEVHSDKVESGMKHLQQVPDVLSVDIAYINYEDDLEREGHIPCAPYERKRKQQDETA